MRLNKILPLLVLPTGVTLGLIILGLVRRRRWPIVVALVLLTTCSLPVVGTSLVGLVEGGASRRVAASVPRADAIVVLSAGRTIAPGPDRVSEWGDANRYFGGVELFEAGIAPRLVFTGAATGRAGDPTEGDTLAAYARRAGVPATAIVVTGPVENTEDEARETARVLTPGASQPLRVVLVTSAFHMTRAVTLFERAGFQVDAFPVDFTRRPDRYPLQWWLPQSGGLAQSELALRELYGRAYYHVRAWF